GVYKARTFSLTLTSIQIRFWFASVFAKGMDKRQRNAKGQWVKGKESALWVIRCAGPAARQAAASLCGCFGLRACSFLLLEEVSEERVVEFVTPASCAYQQSFVA